MSVQSEINRISANVSDAFTAVEEKGGTVPSGATSDSLASSIRSIQGGGGGAQTFSPAARNLLDNSDFTNPVNQRGLTSYSGAGYTIDRWRIWAGSTVTVNNGNITVTGNMLQYVPGLSAGKALTFAYGNANETHFGSVGYEAANGCYYVNVPSGSWTWAALYEGEYTAETLPEYVSKGYAAELLICRQYDLETGEYIGLRKFGYPRNLLDNSDFTNPVNQRGLTTYEGTGGKVYTIDRWFTWSPYIKAILQDGYMSISNSGSDNYQQLSQVITSHKMTGKTVTLAAWDAEGDVHCASGTLTQGNAIAYTASTELWMLVSLADNGDIQFSLSPHSGQTVKIEYAALYEGEYTAETLPEYVPKGYGAELAECRRYYRYRPISEFALGTLGTEKVLEIVHDGMWRNPTVTILNGQTGASDSVASYSSGGTFATAIVSASPNRTVIAVSSGTPGETYFYGYSLEINL